MGLKVGGGLLTCGTCGKSRGITHTCITHATSKRRKTRTKLAPRVTLTCTSCGRKRGLQHTCHPKSDFKARRRKAATAERQRKRKVVRARQAARRKQAAADRRARERARKAKAKTRTARYGPPSHRFDACYDADCERYACVVYKQGIFDCPRTHQ
jgi:sRNA-binding protein